MSFELPTEKVKAQRINPKKLIIFSLPKTGKSELASRLENNLILDLEEGSGFVEGLTINVLELAKKEDISPLYALRKVIDKIKESNKVKNSFAYKYITVDTVSSLEDKYGVELALKLYKDTSQGKNFQGDDVRTLPNGTGYHFLRIAVTMILDELEDLCDTLIIMGHTRDKLIEKDSKEMTSQGLDLAGKLGSIVCSQADAIAFLYRKGNQTIANFKPSEQLTVGARPLHLKNMEIVVLESDEQGNLIDHWDKIFV